MRVPSCLSRHHISLHGAVARNHVLDDARQHMADVRLAVCRRRSIIKSIGLALLTAVHAFPENVIILPEFLYIFFPVHKVQVGVYFVVHCLFLLLSFSLFCLVLFSFFLLKISVIISSTISAAISKTSEIISIAASFPEKTDLRMQQRC